MKTSSLTSYLSCLSSGTAMRRRFPVPLASRVLGAVGSWSPPSPSALSPELPVGGLLPWTLPAALPSTLAETSHLPCCWRRDRSSTLCSNFLSNSSLTFGLKPACLLKNSHALSFLAWKRCTSSACQCSRHRRWSHVHELLALLALLGSVLACGLALQRAALNDCLSLLPLLVLIVRLVFIGSLFQFIRIVLDDCAATRILRVLDSWNLSPHECGDAHYLPLCRMWCCAS